ncbi:unnamed protein product [Pleuronectes platessa]|uniref:Uncharacterized protein n=1 Tax=Pleuronectes platessa TaxID=8262 RepID=A0A9N7TP57_PLEPL|nr:unnamed protein product [Pleuronectes platessa]
MWRGQTECETFKFIREKKFTDAPKVTLHTGETTETAFPPYSLGSRNTTVDYRGVANSNNETIHLTKWPEVVILQRHHTVGETQMRRAGWMCWKGSLRISSSVDSRSCPGGRAAVWRHRASAGTPP